MTKRRREADPDDAAAETAELNTVFVDTSLDTHIAMLICTSDTVSDFKKKMALEHMQCFPEMGEIQVHSVKVKRRSTFYHLPDIMLVWSAFHGVKKNWFLSVDASCIHTSELGTSSGLKIGVTNTDDDCRGFTYDANRNDILSLSLQDGAAEKNAVSEMITRPKVDKPVEKTNTDDDCRGFTYDANRNDILSLSLQDGAAEKNAVSEMIARPKVDKPVEKTTDSHRSIYSEEHFTGAESHAKKKRKVSHEYQNSRDECQNSSLGGGKDGKHTISESVVKVSGVRNDQYDVEGKLVSDGISPPTMAEKSNSLNINGSDRRKENNGFESVFDHGPGQDVPTQHSGVVNTGGGGDVHTAGSRRKKKKVQNTVAKVQDTTDTEHFGKCERIEPSADTHKCDQMEGQGFPLKNDHEVMMLINSKAPGQVEPDLALAEASLLQDAKKCNFSIVNSLKILDSNGRKEDHGPGQDVPTQHSGVVSVMVPDSSARLMDVSGGGGDVNTAGSRRKKKKVQNTVAKVQDTTDTEHFGKCERIEPSADTHKCDQMERQGFSLKNDHEVMMPINSKAPGQVEPDLALAEASLLQDAKKCNFSIVNSLKILDSNGRKENNVLENKLYYELDQDVPTVQSGGVCTNTPNLADAAGGIRDVNTDGKKRKKKKLQTTAAKVQDTKDVEQIGNGEMEKPHSETINSKEKEEQKGASLEHDYEVILALGSIALDHVDPNLALKEASLVRDADAVSVIEPEISSGIKKRKKKKREKKPLGASIENSGITEIQNGIRGSLGLPSPSSDHIPKETGKEENIKLNEGKDVQMKLLDGSNHDAQEKVWDVNRRETDLEIKTQTEQTVVDVSVVKRITAENTKSAAGDCNADLPTAETGNTMMESNEADKDNGNTENGDRKAKNKRKKKKHTATDVQEKEVRHVDSSQILSRKSEEEADKMHELAVNTDDVAENSAKGSEDINFKQYFVPGQLQNKVDSRVEVRKGTKLQGCSKRAKDDDLPGVNISTELQNSSKSFENSKTKNNSYRKDSGRAKGDYMQNSDWDEISHHSFKRSSVAPEIEVKDSSPSELREVTRQKRNGIVAAPTIRNKNPSLDKSIPQKKILLANLGAIFQDFSGESSGDENGIMHSNDRTISSSDDDNSSMSGDSTGESELSHNSTRKGSNDANGKSTSNLDVSMPASKDMTIEMILKSSKRFKKAKEVASQTESQPIDFVPESQPF